MATGLGGLGLFVLGSWLAGGALGHVLAGNLRSRVAHWTSSGRGAFLTGLGLTVVLGWSSSVAASVPALARRWLLPLERSALVLSGCAFACGLIALLAWIEGLGWAVRALACLAIGGGVLMRLARPALATLGEGLAGHGLMLLGIALLGDGLAELAGGLHLWEARGNPLLTLLFVAAGAALGIGLGSPSAAVLVAVQAAAAGLTSVHSSAALLVGAGSALPWLSARAGRLGDVDDGVVAAAHGALGASFALTAGFALFWCDRFPWILAGVPGGPGLALAAFLLAGLAGATLISLALMTLLEGAVRRRLNERRPVSRVPFLPDPLRQSVPALAVESVGASLDSAIAEVRDVARARFHGTALSQARRDLAREVIGQVSLDLAAFGERLDSVRWAGSEVASALASARGAAACVRLEEELAATPSSAPGDDVDLRTELSLAAVRVWGLIEAATRPDELPLLEDLRACRDALDLDLQELLRRAGSCAGPIEYGSRLRAAMRAAFELAEARAQEAPCEPFEACEDEAEHSQGPEPRRPAPPPPLPPLPTARRTRVRGLAPGPQ